MDITKEKFDFVCSLGGNCMAASQLQQRGLRTFSLPFDWLFYKDSTPIYKLIECFKDNFQHFLLKENMRELRSNEITDAHSNMVQYQDTYTEIFFYNHFPKKINNDREFEKVKEKITRRIERFLYFLNKSNKILFIFLHHYNFENKPYIELYNFLREFYPDKEIHIKVIQFGTNEPSFKYDDAGLIITRIKRENNYYDFTKTNIEWQFLDNIECNMPKIIQTKTDTDFLKINKIKKGVSISILPCIGGIFCTKIYLFGLRFVFSLGKIKDIN